MLDIERILAVEEELEIRIWKVETREGPRTFQTARDEWPRPLPGGGLLLRDVAGDLYLVPQAAELDRTSRKLALGIHGLRQAGCPQRRMGCFRRCRLHA